MECKVPCPASTGCSTWPISSGWVCSRSRCGRSGSCRIPRVGRPPSTPWPPSPATAAAAARRLPWRTDPVFVSLSRIVLRHGPAANNAGRPCTSPLRWQVSSNLESHVVRFLRRLSAGGRRDLRRRVSSSSLEGSHGLQVLSGVFRLW